MKEVRRVRYKCDFCRKMTGTRDSMERHESICTSNPKRKCKMCRLAHEAYGCTDDPKTISELKEIFEKDGFSEMREAAVDCPACILAVLRQTYYSWTSTEYEDGRLEWDYKKSHKNLMESLAGHEY